MPKLTNLDILNKVDRYPHPETQSEEYAQAQRNLYYLQAKDSEGVFPVGCMLRQVVDALAKLPEALATGIEIDHQNQTVTAFTQPTEAERTAQIAAITQHWRATNTFRILAGWRNELWPVYDRRGLSVQYNVERAAAGLLGVTRYGVHLNAWVPSPSGSADGIRLWIGRRAADKSTYPGMLDNTAAGGLMTGEDPFECIVREADEEAALPEALVRQTAKAAGHVTYLFLSQPESGGESGLFSPECQWVYDVELPQGVTPVPKDGEVEGFYLWTVDEVFEQLYQGKFKPNCGLVILDFFIRHGIITRENEPNYDEIKSRLRRALPFPGPHTYITA
ncbi:uncharacterized protein BROUX77_005594 [Berkeleyomyces rouxiae]|uniref:uncharacterized protein n=1 Tax=Berkeleyomyces rouxiae TaxID=2035830 RepID=UPI003B7CD3FC